MSASTRRLIIIISILAVIVITGSVTYAYWSGSPTQGVSGENAAVVDNKLNATYKYMVFKPIGNDGDYCFEYKDGDGWVLKYEYEEDYDDELIKAGQRTAIAQNSTIFNEINTTITAVKLVGYFGVLGEWESLEIPESISWNSKTLSVLEIDLKMPEYVDSFNLIKSVAIPSCVTKIKNVSFSGANNLEKVYINKTEIPSEFIDAGCFIGGKNKVFYKKNAQDNYEVFTR